MYLNKILLKIQKTWDKRGKMWMTSNDIGSSVTKNIVILSPN